MKIKDGFILRTICGENIVVGEGLAQVNFNRILSLNESATYLWQSVTGKEFTPEDLTKLLLERYEVTEERAAADVEALLKVWTSEGVVE